jgi:hypothetical protein
VKEKRKVARFDLGLEARVSSEQTSEQTLLSLDVSSAGVFLLTEKPLPPGSKVAVDLLLKQKFNQPDEKENTVTINASGTVIRINGRGMAIAFDERHEIAPLSL